MRGKDADDEGGPLDDLEQIHILIQRYLDVHDASALDEALRLTRRLDPGSVSDPALRALLLWRRGMALQCDFERGGGAESLAEAVAALRQAAETIPDGAPRRGSILVSLCDALRQSGEELGEEAALAEAVAVGRRAMAVTTGSPEYTAAVNNLAIALWADFDRTGDEAKLAEAASLLREAFVTAAPDDRHREKYLANHGVALRELYLATGEKETLEKAIVELRQAIEIAGTEHPDTPAIMGNLALALQDAAECTGDRALLQEAVELLRTVTDGEDPEDPDHGRNLSNLSVALQDWYEMTSDVTALAESVRRARAAVAVTPPDHPGLPARLTHLGLALRMSYENSGDMAMLDEAVEVSRKAVETAGPDHPRIGIYLSNLGLALRFQYERTGSPSVLDEAIASARQAIVHTPDDHPRLASYQSNLALALWTRYERSGDLETLKEAIAAGREAVAHTDLGSPDHSRYATNLGLALWTFHDREPESAALDEAIEMLRGVLARTDTAHAEYARFASNLANALHARYLHGGLLADLEEALAVGRSALERTGAEHVDHTKYASNVGAMLIDRYRRTGDVHDLDEALPMLRAAVAATGPGHLDYALHCLNLGDALHEKAATDQERATELVDEALRAIRWAVDERQAPPSLRVEVAWLAGRMLAAREDWSAAAKMLGTAVELLSRVAPRHLGLRDRGHGLSRFLGLVTDAVATALHCGEAAQALMLLEEGRGILFGQALNRDDDVAALRRRAPELAERFQWLREALDIRRPALPEEEEGGAGTAKLDRDRRYVLAGEWERLLDRIRALPGLERFMRPPPLDALLSAVPNGNVIVLNCSRYRCDAMVIAERRLRVVPLPSLRMRDVTDHLRAFQQALAEVTETTGRLRQAAERRFNDVFRAVSRWLWDAVAEPILHALPPTAQVHRTWWSPTGPLTALPLHAAGRDRPGELADRLIFSYTPTVRTLAGLRSEPPAAGLLPDEVLLVDAAPDLRSAGQETRVVSDLLAAPPPLSGENAHKDAVLSALARCRVAHFAVHAISDPDNPEHSYLDLADQPLTLPEIANARLRHPWLAYLSACDTAAPSDRLPDESLHLAAAFQTAGFPHVVATLWPAEDGTAAAIAERFYSSGLPSDPAVALRDAVRAVRERHPDQPLRWAPYLHLGA